MSQPPQPPQPPQLPRTLEQALAQSDARAYQHRTRPMMMRVVHTTIAHPDDGSRANIQVTELRESARDGKSMLVGYAVLADYPARSKHLRSFLDGLYWQTPAKVERYLATHLTLDTRWFNWWIGQHSCFMYPVPAALGEALDARAGDLDHLHTRLDTRVES